MSKTIKILGIFTVCLIVLVVAGILLVNLNVARNKSTSYSGPRAAPSESGMITIENPLAVGPSRGGWSLDRQGGDVKQSSAETPSRLVIKTGLIYMVVKDINGSVKSIIEYAGSKGGWVVNSSITEREKIPSGNVSVRIPAEIFDEAIAYFKGLAVRVSHEETRGQDVTEEYVDLQSRLRNLEATEKQLLQIMGRSGTIPDILAAQRELTTVRNQIEQTKGRIQYLERSSEMATISINLALSEELLPIPPTEKWRPIYVVRRAWKSLVSFLKGLSYFVIWVVLYAVVWVPLLIAVYFIRRFFKKKRQKEIK